MASEVQNFYPDLPEDIFGLKFAVHSVARSQAVLRHFGRFYSSKDRKPSLIWRLVKLEFEVSDAEATAIRNFVTSGIPFSELLDAKTSDVDPEENGRITGDMDMSQECSLCTDSFSKDLFPIVSLSPSCTHEVTICIQCVTQSVDTQIPDVLGGQVRCPECPETLPYDTVKKWASPEQFIRYDQKVFTQALSGFPNFIMCLGPGCNSGQIHGSGDDQPIMTCTSCSFKTCFMHKMPMHIGKTCAQYDAEQKERVEQLAASEKLIAKTSKVCPNLKCGHGITKDGGCDHMTCRQCGYEFCFLCRASYAEMDKNGNSANEPTCSYHSTRLPRHPRFVAENPPVIPRARATRPFLNVRKSGTARKPAPVVRPALRRRMGKRTPL